MEEEGEEGDAVEEEGPEPGRRMLYSLHRATGRRPGIHHPTLNAWQEHAFGDDPMPPSFDFRTIGAVTRNSWGVAWGEDGYFRLSARHNTCGLSNTAAFVVIG